MQKEEDARMDYPYFDLYTKGSSDISFESWTDTRSVGLHRHSFYELLFIGSGSCRHIYKNVETLLIPGDAVLVSEHKEHGFSLNGEIVIYNCQFALNSIDPELIEVLKSGESLLDELHVSQDEILDAMESPSDNPFGIRENYYKEGLYSKSNYEINSNKQGVIHLSPAEFSFVKTMLENGLESQDSTEHLDELMQKKSLEMILLYLKKAQSRQNQKYTIHSKANQKVIASVLMYIEQHLDEQIDFNSVAEKCSFSPNYFRKLFKDVTGFSPISYVNRLRIIRACEYIQNQKMAIRDAAELVGIYDLNYFSRLFKKIMGFAPSKL